MTEKEFILKLSKEIISEGLKNFPSDFISFENEIEIKLPGKALIIGKEFFGKYEIITTDGSSIYNADDYYQAKFIVYSNRKQPKSIFIPEDSKIIKEAVTGFESYLDSLIKKIETSYKENFSNGKNAKEAVNEIFKVLNLIRY